MSERKWNSRRDSSLQYQAYCTLQVPILIIGCITLYDNIRKAAWHNGLNKHISSKTHLKHTDYTTINGALQIAADLHVKIGRTTIRKLLNENECGFRLGGRRGQWVVDVERFRVVLKDKFNV